MGAGPKLGVGDDGGAFDPATVAQPGAAVDLHPDPDAAAGSDADLAFELSSLKFLLITNFI